MTKKPKMPPTEIDAIKDIELPEGKCGSCKFVDKDPGNNFFCRRYPAQLVVSPQQGIVALFPVVNLEKDWCGEFSSIVRTSH